jgi:periplasmic protein TonB
MTRSFFLCIILLVLLFSLPAFSRNSLVLKHHVAINLSDTIPFTDSMDVFERVEVEASFPGGDPAWIRFIQERLDASVPIRMKAPKGKYTVWIQFIVDVTGKLSDFKALTTNGYGMEKEVIRILKKSPRWTPAVLDGRKVKAYRKQPVTFVVDDL